VNSLLKEAYSLANHPINLALLDFYGAYKLLWARRLILVIPRSSCDSYGPMPAIAPLIFSALPVEAAIQLSKIVVCTGV
jgi:hypothetical protein